MRQIEQDIKNAFYGLAAILSLVGVLVLDYKLVHYFWGDSTYIDAIVYVSLAVVYLIWAFVGTNFLNQSTLTIFDDRKFESAVDGLFSTILAVLYIPWLIVVAISLLVDDFIRYLKRRK